jgi:hypothetical protein
MTSPLAPDLDEQPSTHLRIALEALADTVRRHEEEIRRLRMSNS